MENENAIRVRKLRTFDVKNCLFKTIPKKLKVWMQHKVEKKNNVQKKIEARITFALCGLFRHPFIVPEIVYWMLQLIFLPEDKFQFCQLDLTRKHPTSTAVFHWKMRKKFDSVPSIWQLMVALFEAVLRMLMYLIFNLSFLQEYGLGVFHHGLNGKLWICTSVFKRSFFIDFFASEFW